MHVDGTKYNFEEIGSYQVNTSSGSYTIAIEDMFSGEASSYFNTMKDIFTDMSKLVVPEGQEDGDVQKNLFTFKGLMTDRCGVNGAFFNQFQAWRKDIIPFIVDNYEQLPLEEQTKISRMHHVFCGLHVVHNLGIYAENALKKWEPIAEEINADHGGFKSSNNSRTYSLLYELSKLTSYTHGDQRNGKADEWRAFLKKREIKSYMVSFLHHRFNIIFVLGGAVYYHRQELKEFVNSLEGDNFLHSSIRKDIDYPIYLAAAARALGIFNKLVSGPLSRCIEEAGHIFALNSMWHNVSMFLDEVHHDALSLINENTPFEEKYITKDSIYTELFRDTEDLTFDALTQECLEIICCTCSLMVHSQLKDQLPCGKYHNPSTDVLKETENCLHTNILSERDFAQFDRKLTMKPTTSTIAACGMIMFSNNKTGQWLENKSKEDIEKLVHIARTNKYNWIKKYKQRKNDIIQYKIDQMDKKNLEDQIKFEKLNDDKELLTAKLTNVGFISSTDKLEEILTQYSGTKLLSILQNQIQYRKIVLGQKFINKKWGQVGESHNGKYKKYDIETLKEHLIAIIQYYTKVPEERAQVATENKIRTEAARKELLELKKASILADNVEKVVNVD